MDKRSLLAGIGGAAAFSVVLGLLIGSAGAATAAPDFLTVEQAKNQFGQVARGFSERLPDGVEWPTELPTDVVNAMESDLKEGLTVQVQPGYLDGVAATFWLCSWERELVDATTSGDADRAAVALTRVKKFGDLPWAQKNFVGVDEWYAHVVTPALNGDLSGVAEDILSCP